MMRDPKTVPIPAPVVSRFTRMHKKLRNSGCVLCVCVGGEKEKEKYKRNVMIRFAFTKIKIVMIYDVLMLFDIERRYHFSCKSIQIHCSPDASSFPVVCGYVHSKLIDERASNRLVWIEFWTNGPHESRRNPFNLHIVLKLPVTGDFNGTHAAQLTRESVHGTCARISCPPIF